MRNRKSRTHEIYYETEICEWIRFHVVSSLSDSRTRRAWRNDYMGASEKILKNWRWGTGATPRWGDLGGVAPQTLTTIHRLKSKLNGSNIRHSVKSYCLFGNNVYCCGLIDNSGGKMFCHHLHFLLIKVPHNYIYNLIHGVVCCLIHVKAKKCVF